MSTAKPDRRSFAPDADREILRFLGHDRPPALKAVEVSEVAEKPLPRWRRWRGAESWRRVLAAERRMAGDLDDETETGAAD